MYYIESLLTTPIVTDYMQTREGHIYRVLPGWTTNDMVTSKLTLKHPPPPAYYRDDWGTYRHICTSHFSYLRTFPSHLTFIDSKNLLSSFFTFTLKPKILQSFISSQLTTWFCHDSQITSMSPKTLF